MRGGAWEGGPCREEHGRVDLEGRGIEGEGVLLFVSTMSYTCMYSVALLNPSSWLNSVTGNSAILLRSCYTEATLFISTCKSF